MGKNEWIVDLLLEFDRKIDEYKGLNTYTSTIKMKTMHEAKRMVKRYIKANTDERIDNLENEIKRRNEELVERIKCPLYSRINSLGYCMGTYFDSKVNPSSLCKCCELLYNGFLYGGKEK